MLRWRPPPCTPRARPPPARRARGPAAATRHARSAHVAVTLAVYGASPYATRHSYPIRRRRRRREPTTVTSSRFLLSPSARRVHHRRRFHRSGFSGCDHCRYHSSIATRPGAERHGDVLSVASTLGATHTLLARRVRKQPHSITATRASEPSVAPRGRCGGGSSGWRRPWRSSSPTSAHAAVPSQRLRSQVLMRHGGPTGGGSAPTPAAPVAATLVVKGEESVRAWRHVMTTPRPHPWPAAVLPPALAERALNRVANQRRDPSATHPRSSRRRPPRPPRRRRTARGRGRSPAVIQHIFVIAVVVLSGENDSTVAIHVAACVRAASISLSLSFRSRPRRYVHLTRPR